MANKIQLRRGTKSQLSALGGLSVAEPGYCTDTKDLYVGNPTGPDTIFLAAENIPYNICRQAIINGNFDVWQRGTNFANPTIGTYTADRWVIGQTAAGGTHPTIAISRQSLSPGDIAGASYFYRTNVNGAGSSYGATAEYSISQKIEFGTRMLAGAGRKVTVSFWARSSISGKKIGVNLHQSYGTGGTPSALEVINGQNWTLTSNWTKYTATFTLNTLTGKILGTDNNDYLLAAITEMWGVSTGVRVGASTAETFVGAGNIDIAQVQVSAGDAALPFQPSSFAEELQLCQRYYQKSFKPSTTPAQNVADGGQLITAQFLGANTTIYGVFNVRFSIDMRLPPTVTTYNVSSLNNQVRNTGINVDCTGTAVVDVTEKGFRIDTTTPTGSSGIHPLMVQYTADAEI